MEHSTSLADQIRALVSVQCGIPLAEVRLATRLEEDLGLTGMDAEELLQRLATRFNVDMSGLIFHRHFGPEGSNLLWLFYTPDWLKDHGHYPVTVEHLISVAQAGKWFSPPRSEPITSESVQPIQSESGQQDSALPLPVKICLALIGVGLLASFFISD